MKKTPESEQIRQFFDILESIEKLYDAYARSRGLSYAGLCVLEEIYYKPENCTQKYISEQTHLPKQSVNQIIRAFWEQGYVEMQEIDADRRNKAISLTATGGKYVEKVLGRLDKVEENAIGGLSPSQRENLLAAMREIEASFRENMEAAMATEE